ncbi:hypothetical protein BFS86_20280 [Shewanella algae]|nr:hypothetical protein BFS86_20280 [Shewanella algae]
MPNFPVINRVRISNFREHKTSLIGVLLGILSLSLAHYAGFLMKVPVQIIAVAGAPLAPGVTATFLFYMFFCAVCARVMASMFQLAFLPFMAAMDRLDRGLFRRMSWSNQRHFVKSHTQTIRWESYYWLALQSVLFLLLMLAIYVKFDMGWFSGAALASSLLLVLLTGLVRSGFFLQPKVKVFIRKIKSRPARARLAASATLVTATGASIVVSFILGVMRADLLRNQSPQLVITENFSAMAAVMASSESELLIFQKKGLDSRYVYFASNLITTIEPKDVFEPIGSQGK